VIKELLLGLKKYVLLISEFVFNFIDCFNDSQIFLCLCEFVFNGANLGILSLNLGLVRGSQSFDFLHMFFFHLFLTLSHSFSCRFFLSVV